MARNKKITLASYMSAVDPNQATATDLADRPGAFTEVNGLFNGTRTPTTAFQSFSTFVRRTHDSRFLCGYIQHRGETVYEVYVYAMTTVLDIVRVLFNVTPAPPVPRLAQPTLLRLQGRETEAKALEQEIQDEANMDEEA